MLDQTGSQILVEHSVGRLGENKVDAVRAGGYGGAIRGDENLERKKGARAEVGFGRGENFGELAKNFSQRCDDRRRQTRAAEVEGAATKVQRELVPDPENACSFVNSQAFQEFDARGLGGVSQRCTVVTYGDVVVQGVGVCNSGGWR